MRKSLRNIRLSFSPSATSVFMLVLVFASFIAGLFVLMTLTRVVMG